MNRWNCEAYCDGGVMNEAPDGDYAEYRDTLDYVAALLQSGADPALVVLNQRQREAAFALVKAILRLECAFCHHRFMPELGDSAPWGYMLACPQCARPGPILVVP